MKVPAMPFTSLGGRTYVMVMGCAAVVSVMRWFDHLDNGSFTAIIIATVGAFIAKSSVDEHTKTRADVQKTVATLQADSPPPTTVDQVPT